MLFSHFQVIARRSLLVLYILFCGVSSKVYALSPAADYRQTPKSLGLAFQEIKINTKDGAQLHSWYIPAVRPSAKVLIVSHNGDGNMGDYLKRIKPLRDLGFNVLCYDYRGFGKSSSFDIDTETYLYAAFYEDFSAVYAYALAHLGKKIHLYGWGIGATISIVQGYTAPETYLIVADTPMPDYVGMSVRFRKIGSRMTVDEEVIESYKDVQTVLSQKAGKAFRGILLLVGSKDYLFTHEDMVALQSRISHAVKPLHLIRKNSYADNYDFDPGTYTKQVSLFLANH